MTQPDAVPGGALPDVASGHRQRRIGAIARAAANLASQGSLTEILDALAAEVLLTDALAAVQIVTLDAGGGRPRIMGSAGFRHWPDFFDRLLECRERGAVLHMIEAFQRTEPVVVAHRWEMIRSDPAWEPLHDYLAEAAWDAFASIPLLIRGRAAGVLNVFFAPGQAVDPPTLDFLMAMADQAAIAVDYAALIRQAGDTARREERQRLARDLHDSVVQQVFSISMQAKSLEVLGQRGDMVPALTVQRIADEIGALSGTALADLRAMVHQLRPSSSAGLGDGLAEAVRALVKSAAHRTGLRLRVSAGGGMDRVTGELAEDVYWVIAEAVQNVVRHAEASRVNVVMRVRGDKLTATVTDDGKGIGLATTRAGRDPGNAGYGLMTMRERAERWTGTVTVAPARDSGTRVRLTVPLAPAAASPGRVA